MTVKVCDICGRILDPSNEYKYRDAEEGKFEISVWKETPPGCLQLDSADICAQCRYEFDDIVFAYKSNRVNIREKEDYDGYCNRRSMRPERKDPDESL